MAGLLSSDILEQQFGPTTVEVLYQADNLRIIATRALDSGQILELSYVTFAEAGIKKFAKTHRSVIAGTSIGKAFRADNIEFSRQEWAAFRHVMPANFRHLFGNGKPVTVVDVVILAGRDRTPYAEILETYSPVVDWPRRQGRPTAERLGRIKSFNELLDKIKD